MKFEVKTIRQYVGREHLQDSCKIMLEFWPKGGSLMIVSPYGNWDYSWNSTGTDDIRAFLVGLDKGYLMNKLDARNTTLFDAEGTVAKVKEMILDSRRRRNYTAEFQSFRKDPEKHQAQRTIEEYRELWDAIEALDPDMSADTFFDSLYILPRTHPRALLESCELTDVYCIDAVTMENPNHKHFWEECWLPLVAHWKEELAAEKLTEGAPMQLNVPLQEGDVLVYGTTDSGYSGPLIRRDSISGDYQYLIPGDTRPHYETPLNGEYGVNIRSPKR